MILCFYATCRLSAALSQSEQFRAIVVLPCTPAEQPQWQGMSQLAVCQWAHGTSANAWRTGIKERLLWSMASLTCCLLVPGSTRSACGISGVPSSPCISLQTGWPDRQQLLQDQGPLPTLKYQIRDHQGVMSSFQTLAGWVLTWRHTRKPKTSSARMPTRGAPHAAMALSKHLSKAYTMLRRCGGTISAAHATIGRGHLGLRAVLVRPGSLQPFAGVASAA